MQQTSQANEMKRINLKVEIAILIMDGKCSNGTSSATPQSGFLQDSFADFLALEPVRTSIAGTLARGASIFRKIGGPGRTRTCNQTVMSGRL
jgi:hypothetical protein